MKGSFGCRRMGGEAEMVVVWAAGERGRTSLRGWARTATVRCDGRGWVNARIRWKSCCANSDIKLRGNNQRETRVEGSLSADRKRALTVEQSNEEPARRGGLVVSESMGQQSTEATMVTFARQMRISSGVQHKIKRWL